MHTPTGDRGPHKKIKGRTCKTGLKIQGMRAHNSATSGGNVTKTFPRDVPRGRSIQLGTIFREGPPPKIWEGKKRLKFGAISDNYRLRSRIYPEWIHTSKIGKAVDQLQPLPRWAKKVGELWSTNKKVIGVQCMLTHPSGIFRETTFRPVGGAGPSNFYTR